MNLLFSPVISFRLLCGYCLFLFAEHQFRDEGLMVSDPAFDDVGSVAFGVVELHGLAGTHLLVEIDVVLLEPGAVDQLLRQGVHGPDGVFDVVRVLVEVHVGPLHPVRADQRDLTAFGHNDLGAWLLDRAVAALGFAVQDVPYRPVAREHAGLHVHDYP